MSYIHLRALLACTSFALVAGCMSSGRSSLRGRPGRVSNREPLIYKEYLPRRSELSLSASGAAEGAISRDDARFKELIENNNIDIVFKDEEGTGADRMMTSRCKDKLDSLAIMVMNQWEGVKLRVIEGWDEDGAHAEDSLHYEGRAVDISTSDRDRVKLSLLGRLAYDAGFDYVSYESKNHIHCSVKSDEEADMLGPDMSSGCFASGSHVPMVDGSQKRIEDLRINDKVLSASTQTGDIIPDTVIAFLDVDRSSKQQFMEVSYEGGKLLVTGNHLIYVAKSKDQPFSASNPIYAQNITTNSVMYINTNSALTKRKVLAVKHAEEKGFYAPLTLSGNIIVNNVTASCYAAIADHWLAHLSLSPLRAFHYASNLVTTATFIRPSAGVHWYAKLLESLFPYLLS